METDVLLEQWAASEFSPGQWEELSNNQPSNASLALAKKITDHSAALTVDFKVSNETLWDAIVAQAEIQKKRVIPIHRRRFVWMAASVVALLGLVAVLTLLQPSPTLHTTQLAQQETVALPDGSTAHLSASSELSYYPDGWPTDRVLTLVGEAFFQVEKGSDFVVETAIGTVTVLGTSFTVEARADQFRVQCKTGKVRVEYDSQMLELLPGDAVELIDQRLQQHRVNVEEIGIWNTGRTYFDGVPLPEVCRALEQKFNVTVELDDRQTETLHNGFFQNDNLEKALAEVCKPHQLRYQIDLDQRIVIITQ